MVHGRYREGYIGTCHRYAVVTERFSTSWSTVVCGTDRRHSHAYLSMSSVVDVQFITNASVDTDNEYNFLLRFQGRPLYK